MNIMRKLNTLLRAGARESAERITDANAIRIYRQEIVDAENLLERRRAYLAGLIATRRDLEQEIAAAGLRVRSREQQIGAMAVEERSEQLLLLAARDIAGSERHVANLKQRRLALVERIGSEELTLRKLVAEIREHRREIRILAAQVAGNGPVVPANYGSTVAAQLATLRETRAGISAGLAGTDVAEASFTEALERVDGDPLERELAARGRDAESVHLSEVLERLRGMTDSAAVS
ncbi:MAG: PspA/IM30 family protein [Gammaproteobacteria bacterium]|nr:PspA/IM30 family protein [Gammaproteobacteria bacterium]